jgi:formate hydrogenlyase transcriptional activator
LAATNQELAALVAETQFPVTLHYRLNVFPVALPPLRLRTEDIPMLVAHFLHKCAERMSKPILRMTKPAMETLLRYPWPGTIRELQNFVARAVILTMGDELQLLALPSDPSIRTEPVTLAEAERDHILNALHESNWVVGGASGAAARLGEADDTGQQNARGGLS